MQGGTILPDQKTAPMWFVENVLKSLFPRLSQEKAIDISNSNQSVRDMVTTHLTMDKTPDTVILCLMEGLHLSSARSVDYSNASQPKNILTMRRKEPKVAVE